MTRTGMALVAKTPCPDEEAVDLDQLGDALGESGLGEYVACFDPFSPRRENWEGHRDRAPERLRPLIDLFLLNRTVAPDALPLSFRHQLSGLEALGLLHSIGAGVSMAGGLAILPVFGRWLICHAPQANPRYYFGDDTVALLARLTPKAGGNCLDLCAGPGMLALHAAGFADRVVAIERAPESAKLARLNASLNRLSHRIEVLEGDLYAPLVGWEFDTVIANPPMLPLPAGVEGPAIGHGGEDGLEVVRRLLVGLPQVLRPDGVAQIIGAGLSNGEIPTGVGTLEEAIAGRLDLTLSIVSHNSMDAGAPYLEAVIAAIAAAGGEKKEKVRSAYLDMLRRAGASALCHFFIHARRGQGKIEMIHMSAVKGGTRNVA